MPIWILPFAVLIAGVVGPLLLSKMNAKQRVAERAEDWKRQDEVARKVEEAATRAAEVAVEVKATAGRAEVVAQRAESAVENAQETQHAIVAQGAATAQKLDVIHTLVNSNLMAAVQGEYDANVERLATLLELIDLKRANGREPSPETLEAVTVVQARLANLRVNLAERQQQQQEAAQQ